MPTRGKENDGKIQAKGDAMKRFGTYLKKLRVDAGLSLHRVQELTGYNSSNLWHIEQGRNEMKLYNLYKLSKVYNIHWVKMAKELLKLEYDVHG